MSILNKIKALFEAETPAIFADVKTKDGVILRVEGDIKEGAKVSVIAEDGSISPAPEGEHILDNETKITTDKEGVIIALEAPAEVEGEEKVEIEVEAAEEVVGEEKIEVVAEEIPVVEDKTILLEQKISELEAAIQMIAEELKSMKDGDSTAIAEMTEIKKENKNLKKQVKELAAEPAAPAINFKKVEASDKQANLKTKETPEMLNRIVALREAKK